MVVLQPDLVRQQNGTGPSVGVGVGGRGVDDADVNSLALALCLAPGRTHRPETGYSDPVIPTPAGDLDLGGGGGDGHFVTSDDAEDPAPALPVRRPRPPPSPRTPRRAGTHKLTLKKGRRSRQRYDNERSILTYVGLAPEGGADEDEAENVVPETRSHFRTLLEQEGQLLEWFVDGEKETATTVNEDESMCGRKRGRKVATEEDGFDPEEAFLRTSATLRSGLKRQHHLPLGMLEGIEENIRSFFSDNPQSELFLPGLSSYERLLVHACSTYNSLSSKSFDDAAKGTRTLRIENPSPRFAPSDPSLSSYLKKRKIVHAVKGVQCKQPPMPIYS